MQHSTCFTCLWNLRQGQILYSFLSDKFINNAVFKVQMTDFPPDALAIPEERIKTEANLRTEIGSLEGKYQQLKGAYDSILAVMGRISDDFKEEILLIRQQERKILESYFPQQQEKFLEWILEESQASPNAITPHLSPEDQTLCKALYRKIVLITHPDRDSEGKHLRLFKAASEAYTNHDIFTLQLVRQELETEKDVYSRRFHLTLDDLVAKKADLEILNSQLHKHLGDLEFAGIELAAYLTAEFKLDVGRLNADIRTALGKKICGYAPLQEIKTTSSTPTLSTETALIRAEEDTSLALIDNDEKEHFLRSRIQNLVQRINRLTPYFSGLIGSGIYLRIMSDESCFADRVVIHHDTFGEIRRTERGLPDDESKLIEFDANVKGRLNFLLYPSGNVVIPRDKLNDYGRSAQVLDRVAEVFSQRLKILDVADPRGNILPILGSYDEYTSSPLLQSEYQLSNTNEVLLARLLRALILMKVPRLVLYEDVLRQYVYVGRTKNSYLYDGSCGTKQDGDRVRMKIRNQQDQQDQSERLISGEIVTIEERQLVEDSFGELLGCNEVHFTGQLSVQEQKIPAKIDYRSSHDVGSAIPTIKNTFGFELQIDVGGKKVAVHYDRMPDSNEYALSIKGIAGELFPELVFQLVEYFRAETVKGKYFRKELEYL